MSRARCKIDDLDTVIGNILKEYADDVNKGLQTAVPKIAKIAQQEVKADSPVRKKDTKKRRKGRYKRGWTVKEDVVDRLRVDYIVHNRTDYQLTHLLEKGHVLVRGGRTRGRIPAQVHIAPAEEHAIKNFEEAVVRIAQGQNS